MTFCLRKQRSGSFQWEMEEAVGEGAARLHGSTAGREGSGGEGERGAPSVLPRRAGDAGTHRGGCARAALTPSARRPPRPRGAPRDAGSGRGDGALPARAAPSSQRVRQPKNERPRCARFPPTRSIPRQTSSRGPGARFRSRRLARVPHTASPGPQPPPGPLPAERPRSALRPHRLGTPPSQAPRSHPSLGAHGAGIPLAHGGRPTDLPRAPRRGQPSPCRPRARPALRSAPPAGRQCRASGVPRPAPALRDPDPEAAGPQTRTRTSASAPQGSRPRGQMRGPKPSGRQQHPSRRVPSPAAGP